MKSDFLFPLSPLLSPLIADRRMNTCIHRKKGFEADKPSQLLERKLCRASFGLTTVKVSATAEF
jgi:hypothetical protein